MSGYIPTENGWRFAESLYDDEAPREVALQHLDTALELMANVKLTRAGSSGDCDDCEGGSLERFVVGTFVLCRSCASRRVRAAGRIEPV
jgi:hypothetical protein